MNSTVTMSNKIRKQLEHLGDTEQRRIKDVLARYPNCERKKIWFLNANVSRIKCGKFRLLIKDTDASHELIFFGLRNDVYRRAKKMEIL